MQQGQVAGRPDPGSTTNDSGAFARVASSSSPAKRGPGRTSREIDAARSARLQGVSPPDLRKWASPLVGIVVPREALILLSSTLVPLPLSLTHSPINVVHVPLSNASCN